MFIVGISMVNIFLLFFSNIQVIYEAHQPPMVSLFENRPISLKSRFKNLKIITITESLKEYYSRRFNYFNNWVCIRMAPMLKCIKNTSSKNEIRNLLNLSVDRKIITHTGNLFKDRGIEKLIKICEWVPEILVLQIGGSTDEVDKFKLNNEMPNNFKILSYVTKNK